MGPLHAILFLLTPKIENTNVSSHTNYSHPNEYPYKRSTQVFLISYIILIGTPDLLHPTTTYINVEHIRKIGKNRLVTQALTGLLKIDHSITTDKKQYTFVQIGNTMEDQFLT